MKFSLTLSSRRLIRAPEQRVWLALCRISGFDPEKGLPLGGAAFAHPLGLKARVPVEAVEFSPGRSLAWRVRWLGIQSQKSVRLIPHGGGTMVESREMLSGWFLLLARPFYSPRRLGEKVNHWLDGLAKASEGIRG